MARTTVSLDDELLAEARVLYGTDSPSVVVNAALRDAVTRARLTGFDPVGDIELDLSHDQLAAWRDGRA